RLLARTPPVTLLDVFGDHARRRPGRPLLLFGREVFSYGDLDRRSNQAARAFWEGLGLRRAQPVAVLLANGPPYVWSWLALAKLGCPPACVNVHARGAALRHALKAAGATVLISEPGEGG
ncbi:S27A2 synthetase, partial [Piaya cayana]|nr:S27A2 synthetase [Piaya cayana]